MSKLPTWERCSSDQPDYTPSDACVQLWRVLLFRNEHGDLYGYAEERRASFMLDLGVKPRYAALASAPPRSWISRLAEFWGVALPEAGS